VCSKELFGIQKEPGFNLSLSLSFVTLGMLLKPPQTLASPSVKTWLKPCCRIVVGIKTVYRGKYTHTQTHTHTHTHTLSSLVIYRGLVGPGPLWTPKYTGSSPLYKMGQYLHTTKPQFPIFFIFFFHFIFCGCGDGTRALHMLGKWSTTELHSQPYSIYFKSSPDCIGCLIQCKCYVSSCSVLCRV
jgi:hypothetical protein